MSFKTIMRSLHPKNVRVTALEFPFGKLRVLNFLQWSKLLCVHLAFLLISFPHAALAAEEGIAALISLEGTVEGLVKPETNWKALNEGQNFAPEDKVKTLLRSRAGIRFKSGYLVRMSEKTTITFNAEDPGLKAQVPAQKAKKSISINMAEGKSYFFSRTSQSFPTIRTPQVSASIRGTEFVLEVTPEQTTVSVLDGEVFAENDLGSVSVGPGELATVRTGQAPVKEILVNPTNAVQWALYYPALFSPQDSEMLFQEALNSNPGAATQLSEAMRAYENGDSDRALRAAEQYQGPATPGLELFIASLLLSRGQVADAEQRLKRAEQAASTADANLRASILAQQAIIALVQTDTAKARALSDQALALAPDSGVALLARSYVAQADFDLPKARGILEHAVSKNPQSAFAKARLAELLLGFNESAAAARLLKPTLKTDDTSAYAQAVQGFALLTGEKPEEAEASFRKALERDPALALSRLGLGLAQIRQGDLQGGRESLEEAVHLAPNVSLYRSYLAKAFYEEQRNDVARKELARAMELDQKDPTPYLYRAYVNLAEHRPLEALEDVQQSIARNDNRAVFRSRLLLDQDEATRSTGLGRIYSRVGFTELARIEAISALNQDYSNYSAHFLLADLYRDTHLNERAQTTENIIGRLLSPVTFNSNDLNIGGDASLNEYTTLFDRPTDRTNLKVQADSQIEGASWQGDYTLRTGKLGTNMGYAGEYRNGFRENDFARRHQIFNLGQYSPKADETFVWDSAVTFNDQGDLNVNFDPELEDKDLETDFTGVLVRGGYKKELSPGTFILGQTFYNFGRFDQRDENRDGRVTFFEVNEAGIPVGGEAFSYDGKVNEDLDIDQHLSRADLQVILDRSLVSVVSGISGKYERLDSEENGFISDIGSSPELAFLQDFPLSSQDEIEQNEIRLYTYSTWHLLDWLNFDAGIVYSRIDLSDNALTPPFVNELHNKDEWSPKTGFTVDFGQGTKLRTAFSKTLDNTQRGGLGPIEPTFVGGFSQLYDGVEGTRQELYGVGLDHAWATKTFFGGSYQYRQLDFGTPRLDGGLNFDRLSLLTVESLRFGSLSGAADVDTVKAYFYQVFTNTISSTLDYTFERFNETDPFPVSDTNRVASRMNYFDPSGFFAFGQATFRAQERAGDLDFKTDEEFWVLDAGLGYEFNNRHGALSARFLNILDEDFKYSAITDEERILPRFGAIVDLSLNF